MAVAGVEHAPDGAPATFRDPEMQSRFVHDGIVRFPALGPDDLARIEVLHRARSATEGPAFAPDFAAADRSLVAETTTLARELLDPVIERVFADHRICFATLVVKDVGDSSGMEPHDDRSYVDERRHRALTVWVPTIDTSPEIDNGCLHVVPGSHRLATSPAGSNTPDWYRPYLQVLAEGSVPFPCRAGDALAYDTRTVHHSPPNRSGRVRLALAVVVVPRGAEIVHVEAMDRVRRRLYVVDEEFYLRHSPRSLRHRVPPEAELIEEFEVDERDVEPTSVAELVPDVDRPIVPTVALGEPCALDEARPALVVDPVTRVLLRRVGAGGPSERPPEVVPWSREVVGGSSVAREELRGPALAGDRPSHLPWIDAPHEAPVTGRWGVLSLSDPEAARWFPATRRLVLDRPGLIDAEIWVVAGRTAIGPRVGAVPGALRLLVGLSQPVCPAGIRFADHAVALPMAVPVVVDEAHPHVIWNDGEEPMAVLVATVVDPDRSALVRSIARWSRRLPAAERRRRWLAQSARMAGWDAMPG